ncbi:MAG: AAA family ATPase [Myxococcota bacterium]
MRYRNQTRGAASVVVIGVNNTGMGLIRECLGTEAVLPTQSTPYLNAEQVVQKTRPNVIIMGFDQNFESAVELGPRLSSELPGVQLVAISEQTDPERIRSAMRAGYREYVVLPDDAPLLRQAVHDAAYGSEHGEDLGEVIALIGAKGGSGTTLMTVNLAAALSALHRVCIADFDFSMGDIAAFMDLKPNSSIQDLLSNVHRIDPRMFRGSVSIHPESKVHILSQPTELVYYEESRQEDIVRILGTAAEAYQYVLVDCGSHLDTATMTATSAADRILLMCMPDVVSVKNAWRRLQLLNQQSIEKDVIRLVLNQWEKNAEVSDRDIEKNLKIPIAARIHKDEETCRQAVTYGKLLQEIKKTAPVTQDITAAVSLITEGAEQVEMEEVKGGPFGWLFR